MALTKHKSGQPVTTKTVRDAVMDLLREFGMTTVFGNPGSTELSLFLDYPTDFRYVLGLQESLVVAMADGYAQATRNAAFINLHSAVGVGHAMGSIFTAYKNCTPLVITAGQQSRAILPFDPFLFSSRATELPQPYVKWSIEPARAEDVPQAIARAYYVAMQAPRGPVLVSVPADDWARSCEPVHARHVSTMIRPEPALIDEMGDMLDKSRRPAFVIGTAIDRDQAWDQVVALAERHNAAVWVAPMTGRCGFPEDHPLFAGFLPAARESIVQLLGGCDLVFALGAPAFTYHVDGVGPHLPQGCHLAQISEDPDVVAWAPTGVAAVGSVRLGIEDLLARRARPRRAPPSPRVAPPRLKPTKPMSIAYVLQTLADLRPRDSIVVEEATSARPIMQRYLPFFEPDTFYTMCSGGLGFGLPAAVGVALGKPGKKVIGVLGDGAAMYSIQGLWSAVQLNLPIMYVILKNRRYATLKDFASVYGFVQGDELQGTDLPGMDFVSLARGQGCDAVTVSTSAQLRSALRKGLANTKPVLIEVDVA
jgi:benzoylformate decarboxylase